VRAVALAFERRRLAHVAAHGTFRADNPQFSSLHLADGPLTVYDLERIVRPPEWIVLSACEAGRSEAIRATSSWAQALPCSRSDASRRLERGGGAR